MAKPRGINRFFSPRVQGQFIPQFVEEQLPFKEAFLVGSGVQQRLDDLVAQATELGQTEVLPNESDIQAREQVMSELQAEVEDITSRKGGIGEIGQASTELSKLIGRTRQKDFFKFASANVDLLKRGVKQREKLKDPFTRQGRIFKESTVDPDTGQFRVLPAADIIERPNFVDIADDRFDDIQAQATERLVDRVIDGKKQSITVKQLSDKKLRQMAKDEVDGWLRDNPDYAIDLQQRGVKPAGMRQATEEFLYDRLKFKAQSDTSIEYVAVPETKEDLAARYKGWGIGSDISANVRRSDRDTQRVATMGTTVDRINPSTGEILTHPTTGETITEPGVPEPITFTSQNQWTIRRSNEPGDNYTLFAAPQDMYSVTNFGDKLVGAALEDFELDTVEDYEVLKEDAVIDGDKYEAGKPLPDKALYGGEGGTRLVSENFTERKLFVVGRINAKEDNEESIMVPYDILKKNIKTVTGRDGKGGFEINSEDFFGDQLSPLERALSFTDDELRADGWSEEQIKALRASQ